MESSTQPDWVAFEGARLIASGPPVEVAAKVKAVVDRGERAPVLVFDRVTSVPVDLDLRGTAEAVAHRLAGDPTSGSSRGPGRPKLGVVAREVTLLPRHWEWLAEQPGGASVALRKLVEQARRTGAEDDRRRRAIESAYRFISAMAGDRPGFEEATRALFAGDRRRFQQLVSRWPVAVRDHAAWLAESALERLTT
jgi:hypothetical protein